MVDFIYSQLVSFAKSIYEIGENLHYCRYLKTLHHHKTLQDQLLGAYPD